MLRLVLPNLPVQYYYCASAEGSELACRACRPRVIRILLCVSLRILLLCSSLDCGMDAAATEPWFFTLFDDESFGSFIAVKKPTRHASFGLLAKAAAAELDRDDVAQVRLALYIVTDAAGMPLRTKPTDAQCRSAISGAVLDGVDSPADASFSRAGKCFFVLKIKNGTSTVTHGEKSRGFGAPCRSCSAISRIMYCGAATDQL